MLMKETEDHKNQWKDMPCSWIGRVIIVKLTILSETINRFNATSMKLPLAFFTELEHNFLKLVQKHKRPQRAKTTLRKNTGAGGFRLLGFRLYYKAAVNKTVWRRHNRRQTDQCNRIEGPEINPHIYGQLSTKKKQEHTTEKRKSIQ